MCVAYYNMKGSTLDYGSINRGDGNWLDFGYIFEANASRICRHFLCELCRIEEIHKCCKSLAGENE